MPERTAVHAAQQQVSYTCCRAHVGGAGTGYLCAMLLGPRYVRSRQGVWPMSRQVYVDQPPVQRFAHDEQQDRVPVAIFGNLLSWL